MLSPACLTFALLAAFAGCDDGGEDLEPENSYEACHDNKDNDGDGLLDCTTVFDNDKQKWIKADPDCCPISADSDGLCVLDESYCTDPTPMGEPSGACSAAAQELGCEL